jgi:hypothetical protein
MTFKGNEPEWIKKQITEISVEYINFDGVIKTGIILCNQYIAESLIEIFQKLLEIKFPIHKISPISEFNWDDDLSCISNNSSCYNYRNILGTDKLSDHSVGMAIDINPMQNPWITNKYGNLPKGSLYNIEDIGTITNEVVNIFKKYGFLWGGKWENPDYQHFYIIK